MRSRRSLVALGYPLLLACGGNLHLDGPNDGGGALEAGGSSSGGATSGGSSGGGSSSGSGSGGSAEAGVDCGAPGVGPVVLAAHQSVWGRLAVNEAGLYWVTSSSSSASQVMAVSLCGGAPIVLASGSGDAWGIAADDTSVYWTEQLYSCQSDGGGCTGTGNVMRVPAGGGTPSTLAAGSGYPWGIAVDGANAYWVNEFTTIMKVSLGGGAPTTLATGVKLGPLLAVDRSSAYWASFSSGADGTVQKVPLGGGAVTVLAAGLDTPAGIAVSATSAYWQEGARSFGPPPKVRGVMSVPIVGGAPTIVDQGPVNGFVVDSANLYWVRSATAAGNYTDGAIVKAPLAGGNSTTIAAGLSSPGGIAVDATSVYWVEGECVSDGGPCAFGSVVKLTPK